MSFMNKVLVLLLALILAACGKTEATEKASSVEGSGKAAQSEPVSSPRVSREPALNASPLGVEIGYANLSGFKQKLGSMSKLTEAGKSDHTGGVILTSDGQGLGVDGLSQLLAIFDKNETLVAVVMTLPKKVNDTYSKLAQKYTPVSNNINSFMDNGSAKLDKGDSLIMIEAPHLSFTMDVVYATKTFMADFERNTAEAQAKKQQEQKDKL
jgi:hypothetical protein